MPSPEASLTINSDIEHGWAVLDVDGDLDMASAPALGEAVATINGADPRPIAFELDGIGFIDSSGLRALLEARKDANGELVLINPSSAVTDLLELTLLTDAFSVVESRGALNAD